MSNIIIQNNDVNGLVVWEPVYWDDVIGDFSSAKTYEAGTVLRREDTNPLAAPNGILTAFESGAITEDIPFAWNAYPVAILTQDFNVPHQTAPGDEVPVRVLIGGKVRLADLKEVGVPGEIYVSIKYLLKQAGIFALDTKQLAELDNQ